MQNPAWGDDSLCHPCFTDFVRLKTFIAGMRPILTGRLRVVPVRSSPEAFSLRLPLFQMIPCTLFPSKPCIGAYCISFSVLCQTGQLDEKADFFLFGRSRTVCIPRSGNLSNIFLSSNRRSGHTEKSEDLHMAESPLFALWNLHYQE